MADDTAPGRTEKVRRAGAIARQALGHELAAEACDGLPPAPRRRHEDQGVRMPAGESMAVLTLGEAAARLGLKRDQLVAMADSGRITTVAVGAFGARFVPAAEVERMKRP